ncbi:hypothetical protein SAMN05421811_108379 [Nonomuraea wenchangensis]|uniref:Uncharacterized protein n=1 Tax=Nonomuraea wenchangensis TaxID=568860 RepID=A0A1I0KLV1_9ACTN|nr:hypothetical protein SAMN05421811_108379 [Nonomuraea wenchangensis]
MYFIHRDWEAGPLCKTVRHVPGRTVLEWFRGLWEPGGLDRAHSDLDGAPYEVELLRECGDTPPEDMVELRRRIRTQLWADGELHVDDHSIRIRSMGVHLEEAFYFVDDARVAEQPDRWAYPLHPSWPLPDAAAPGPTPFVAPLPCVELASSTARDAGATYMLFTTLDGRHDTLAYDRTYVLPGVRLPQLAAALRRPIQDHDAWPGRLLDLRASVAPDEGGIAPALERVSRFAGDAAEFPEPHDQAHRAALEHLRTVTPDDGRLPERTLIHVGEHLALMALHADSSGHRPWFVFDDVWASAHPDLAASLIHYAYHWDPGCTRRHGLLMPCGHEEYLDLRLGYADRVRDYEPYDEPLVTELTGVRSVAELRRQIFQDAGTGEQRLLLVLDQDHRSELFGVVGAVLGHPTPDACELRYFHLGKPHRDRPEQPTRLIKALCFELRKEGYANLVLRRPPDELCRKRLDPATLRGTAPTGRVISLTDFYPPEFYALWRDPFRL